jgi:aminoglycoside phosphotransferase (APT) family kinase protein
MIATSTAEELAKARLGGSWKAERFGAGRFSETFLLSRNGEENILRIAPPDDMLQLFYEYRMMRQEPELHRIIAEKSEIPIPRILAQDFSRSRVDRDYLIMNRVTGTPLSERSLDVAARRTVQHSWGAYIRQLHAIYAEPERFGYLGAHRPMEVQSSWPQAFAEMYRLELEDIRRCGVYGAKDYRYAMDLLEKNRTAFENCERASLCHGDIWVTNLMVDSEGTVQALIDFDRACWGDPEWDLAIADYCGVTDDAFFEGYGGDPRSDNGAAAIRRLFYLLYEHQKYIVISVSGRRNDPVGARRYADQSLDLMRRFERDGIVKV